MQEQLRALIRRHCATLADELEAVRGCLSRIDGGDEARARAVAEGIALTHKIKGSSGSIGFQEISASSAKLELCLRSLIADDHRLEPTRRHELDVCFQEFERLIASVTPECSSLYEQALVK